MRRRLGVVFSKVDDDKDRVLWQTGEGLQLALKYKGTLSKPEILVCALNAAFWGPLPV